MNEKSQIGTERPLHGIRVVDLGHYVAAPLAAMFLADQGADVVRIRRPNAPVDTPLDEVLDRGKRVVTPDLNSANGKASALELLAEADIVLDGHRAPTPSCASHVASPGNTHPFRDRLHVRDVEVDEVPERAQPGGSGRGGRHDRFAPRLRWPTCARHRV